MVKSSCLLTLSPSRDPGAITSRSYRPLCPSRSHTPNTTRGRSTTSHSASMSFDEFSSTRQLRCLLNVHKNISILGRLPVLAVHKQYPSTLGSLHIHIIPGIIHTRHARAGSSWEYDRLFGLKRVRQNLPTNAASIIPVLPEYPHLESEINTAEKQQGASERTGAAAPARHETTKKILRATKKIATY